MKDDFASISMKIRNQAVTGSQTKLDVKNGSASSTLLVDNGAFQDKEGEEFPFEDYSDVDAAFLTHAHIDHSGGLANMAKQVYIPVYATAPTLKLIAPMLKDMYNVMGMHGAEVSKDDLKALDKLKGMLKEAKLYSKIGRRNYEATFIDNAHILGASMVYIKALDNYRPISILFSGDYREEHPFLRTYGINSFIKNNPVDVFVLESTYGNREPHIPFSDSINMLEEILVEGLKKGDVLLGSFSVDRTPVLLHMINQIQKSNSVIENIPVYLDGKLAIEALEIYKQYESKFKCCWADIIPKNFHIISGKEERKAIQADPTPKIIIATSGNYHGGSIVSWVYKMLPNPNSTLGQCGYIAHPIGKSIFSLPSGEILNYVGGAELVVRASRVRLEGSSAHADNPGLLKIALKVRKVNPKAKIVLTHGEDDAKLGTKQYFIKNGIPEEDIYIQGPNQHFEINKHTLASGKILVDD